jgi:hypothetical protein
MLASKAPIWVVFVGCVTRIGLNTSTEGQKIRRAELFKTERFAKHTEEGPLGRRKAFWARRFDWVLPDANRAEYVRRRPKNSSSGEVQNPMVCKTHRGGAVGAAKSMFGEDDLTRCCLTRIGLNRSTEGPKKPSRGGVQNPVDCKTHRGGAVGSAKSMFGEDDLTRRCLTRIGLNTSAEGLKIRRAEGSKTQWFAKHTVEGPSGRRKACLARMI